MKIAVIDLGTNTFNLLVCEISYSSHTTLHESRLAPRLGKEGIQNGIIAKNAIERGFNALQQFSEIIKKYECEKVIAIGTSALRNASNANDFVNLVKKELQIDIQIIPGSLEAEYIYNGNKLAYNWGKETAMILDIGGGSNEIIICSTDEIYWKHSFENGMQRICNNFNTTYPFSNSLQDEIQQFLNESFKLLHEKAKCYSIDLLIGSSGAFDTFKDINLVQKGINDYSKSYFEFDLQSLKATHNTLINSTKNEIHNIPGMDSERVELIPFASTITQYLIKNFNIPRVIQSSYSLKEGVVSTLMD